MLPTKKRETVLGLDGVIIYLYGPPKIGKTTFAANLETKKNKVLFLDCEGGTLRIEPECLDLQIAEWMQFDDALRELHKDKTHGFGVIVVDSLTELREQLIRHVCNIKRAKNPSDPKFGGRAGWGLVAQTWKNALNLLMAGPWCCVFLDHATQVETDMAGNKLSDPDRHNGPKKMTYFPTLSESARFVIAKRSDLMIRAYKNENGDRVATCTDLDGMGGQRGNVLPDSFPLDGKIFLNYFREAYKKRKESSSA